MFAAMSAGPGVDEGEEGAVVGCYGGNVLVSLLGWEGVWIGIGGCVVQCAVQPVSVCEEVEVSVFGLRGWMQGDVC